MTINLCDIYNNRDTIQNSNELMYKYEIDVLNTPVLSDGNFELDLNEKKLIIDKLLEAKELANINVKAGNITKRGFATNICTYDGFWSLGTNFNNTRNDISSICGERSAILVAYNQALMRYLKNPEGSFNFKIKYLCMSSSLDIDEIKKPIAPCEDCLSWLNTNKYFDSDTVVFAFEKNKDEVLSIRASKLVDILPYREKLTSNVFDSNKKIIYTQKAYSSLSFFRLKDSDVVNLLKSAYESYIKNTLVRVSNQNIAASILANGEIFSESKTDWTKRWFSEPLEACALRAVNKYKQNTKISMLAYFGDEFSQNGDVFFDDGVVSIKSLGRIRQKFANPQTLLVLNFNEYILVTTVGEYLPKKFIQGYKI